MPLIITRTVVCDFCKSEHAGQDNIPVVERTYTFMLAPRGRNQDPESIYLCNPCAKRLTVMEYILHRIEVSKERKARAAEAEAAKAAKETR